MFWRSNHGHVEQRQVDPEFIHDPPALNLQVQIQVQVFVRARREETEVFRPRRSFDLGEEASKSRRTFGIDEPEGLITGDCCHLGQREEAR